jgi:hypothetical protein
MKLMIATMIRGSRSCRSASTRSWNGVVNASSSAAWTLIQLFSAIVANCSSPSPLIVSVRGPMTTVASGSPGRVKTSGSAASRNGAASSARRAGRNGPRWATVESATTPSQASPSAMNDPTGRRLTATMNVIVATNFSRASARWSGLSLAT